MLECDYLIVGGGDTGISLAESLKKLDKSIVLVESNKLGGVNLNNIVIPKKCLFKEIKTFPSIVKNLQNSSGINDMLNEARLILANNLKTSISKKYRENFEKVASFENLKIFFGTARLLTKSTAILELGDKKVIVRFKKCLLCTGKVMANPVYIQGIESVKYLTKSSIFRLEQVPDHLAIIGVTVESMEVAMFYTYLGIKVSIFEQKSKLQVLSKIDRTMATYFINKALFNFVNIHFETKIINISNKENQLIISTEDKLSYRASHIYIHIKDRFDKDSKTVSGVKLRSTSNGIKIDSNNKTNIKNIFSFGSCADEICSKKITLSKIDIFTDLEKKQDRNKHKKLSTQIILNTVNFISNKSKPEVDQYQTSLETGYFLDTIGVGMSELQAKGKYGPRVIVSLITNKQQTEFVKLIYFAGSKKIVGYWATSFFKTHFSSLLMFSLITKSNAQLVIDIIRTELKSLEGKQL